MAEKVAPIKVVLNGGEQATFTRWDGSFVFRDVSPGRYVVDIPSEQFLFSQVCLLFRSAARLQHLAQICLFVCGLYFPRRNQFKVDIAEDGVIRALEYKYPGMRVVSRSCLTMELLLTVSVALRYRLQGPPSRAPTIRSWRRA